MDCKGSGVDALCHAANLSSGWSLGSCAEHSRGKRAAGRVCWERVGRGKTGLAPSLCSDCCQGLCVHVCPRVFLCGNCPCSPVSRSPGHFPCQTQPPAASLFKRQRQVMLCCKMPTVRRAPGSRDSSGMVSGLSCCPAWSRALAEGVSALAVFTPVELAK